MKKKIKFIILLICVFFISQIKLISDEFYFEGEEIQILDEGNKLISKNGVKITTNTDLIFEGQEFEYDKAKLELVLSNNVVIRDITKNILIKTNKIKYFKKNEKLFTYQTTEVNLNDKYLIKSEDVVFDRSQGILSSNKNTSIIDNYRNELISNEFKFFTGDQIIKAKDALIKDNFGNNTLLKNFVGNLNNDQFFGKDVKINFSKSTFGNTDNDPRLYGNTVTSTKNTSQISKGVFTTCKKNDDCPPWKLSADKIKSVFVVIFTPFLDINLFPSSKI